MLSKAVKMVFLCDYLHSEELRREINGKSERRYDCVEQENQQHSLTQHLNKKRHPDRSDA